MLNDTQKMLFELEDIESVEDAGYSNCYDITVSNEDHSFILANGAISHNSALGGLLPTLGRKECGYYMLKGKPLNAYSSTQKRFTENKELTGLFQIIKDGVIYFDMPDGQFYEIEIGGKKVIASENDEVLVNGKWVSVKRLLKKAGIKSESVDW